MIPAPSLAPAGPSAIALDFPDMYVCCTKSCVLQGLPLRCSLTAAICAQGSCRNESASSSGDRAGDSQSVEGKGDKYEPERRVLFSSDSGTEKEDAQKQELHLEDLNPRFLQPNAPISDPAPTSHPTAPSPTLPL